ncbi:MAG: LCP family protein [Eubacteriales bacterium]|nr:LCP family protein [Eubacteriales bacterium]
MTKRTNREHHNSDPAKMNGEKVNEELQSVISNHWRDNQAPGFTGYQTNKNGTPEKEVRFEEKGNQKPTRHSQSENDGKKEKPKKKRGKASKIIRAILLILLLLIVIGGGTYAFMNYRGHKAALEAETTEEIQIGDKAISENGGINVTYKGVNYTLNRNISSILFIGVDKENYEEEETEYGAGGQSDTLILITVNHKTGETKMIPISRNSMVMVDQYNSDGTYWKQNLMQVAAAYAYGDGKETSCKNTLKAVSRLLYGMPINQYVSIDLSCVKSLNDAIGGVEVTVLEDLNVNDNYPDLVKGNVVTLMGDEAEYYIRHRKTVIEKGEENIDNNDARMERQKQYITAFSKKAINMTKKDLGLPLDLYSKFSDDMVTDITPSELVYYATLLLNKGFNNSMVSIPGSVEHKKKTEFTEFYPDQEALYQIVLDTFYEITN